MFNPFALFGQIPGIGVGYPAATPAAPMPVPRPALPAGSPMFGGSQPVLPGGQQIGVGPGAPLGGYPQAMPGALAPNDGSLMGALRANASPLIAASAGYFAHPEQGMGGIFSGWNSGYNQMIDQAQQAEALGLNREEYNLRKQIIEDKFAQNAGQTNAQNATRDWALQNRELLGLPDNMDADTLDALFTQYPELPGKLFERAAGVGDEQYEGAFTQDIIGEDGKPHTMRFNRAGEIIKDLGVAPPRSSININTGELKEGQATIGMFARRMTPANQALKTEFNNYSPTATEILAARKGGDLGALGLSPRARTYFTHAQNFLAAYLRKTGGATLTDPEVAMEYANFFPMPGDGPEQIALKARYRQFAVDGMLRGLPEEERRSILDSAGTAAAPDSGSTAIPAPTAPAPADPNEIIIRRR